MIMLCGTSCERLTLEEAIRITDPATCQEALYKYGPEERAAVENEARHIAAQALREKQTGGWISVKDRLPPARLRVLVCFSGNRNFDPQSMISFRIPNSKGFMYESEFGKATDWQPLPGPPIEDLQ